MTGAIVAIAIVLIVIGGITTIMVAHFQLQRHRTDAVAMTKYRELAEQAGADQEALRGQLAELTARVTAVENLLRSID